MKLSQSMKNREKNKYIYGLPVIETIDKIKSQSGETIFLAGKKGTGKTTVLHELLSSNKDLNNPIINGTVSQEEFILIEDLELFRLYQICLIVYKMLLFIRKNHNDYVMDFVKLEARVKEIVTKIKEMYVAGKFELKYSELGREICKNPEDLLEEFLSIATKKFDYKTVTLVLDDFDVIGDSSSTYQRHMYNLLKEHVKLIASVSDKEVLDSESRKESLSKKGDIVVVNYSLDIDIVKHVLDDVFIRKLIIGANPAYNNRIGFILSDDVIGEMIKRTDGNIFDMTRAVSHLYNNIFKNSTNLNSREERGAFILKYIDEEINIDPNLSDVLKQERKLFIR